MEWWYRVGNPVVAAVLRSPLHPLLSRRLVLLTLTGRRSGRTITLPAMYARAGDDLIVLSGRADAHTWWRNLRGGAPVRVRLRGHELDAHAVAVAGRDDPTEVAEGAAAWLARFPRSARRLGVRAPPGGGLDPGTLTTAARRAALVRVTLPTGR